MWLNRVALLSVLFGLAAGCAAPTVSLASGPRAYVATDYDRVLRRWTRTENLIELSELENHLTATATYESWDFRWAYVIRYANDYRLTTEQRKKLLERTLEGVAESHSFFVAIYGGTRRYNDLSSEDSAWIVRLIDGTGTETAPVEVTSITKPNAIERTYFPYNKVWRRAFRITFPVTRTDGTPAISPKAKWFGLRFAGAQGNSELLWDLDASDEQTPEESAP